MCGLKSVDKHCNLPPSDNSQLTANMYRDYIDDTHISGEVFAFGGVGDG